MSVPVDLLARGLMAAVFAYSAIEKATHWRDALSEIGTRLPWPPLMLVATIVVQGAGAAALASGVGVTAGALALCGFTFVATGVFHRFWTVPAGRARVAAVTAFLEHLALCGGLLAVAQRGIGCGWW